MDWIAADSDERARSELEEEEEARVSEPGEEACLRSCWSPLGREKKKKKKKDSQSLGAACCEEGEGERGAESVHTTNSSSSCTGRRDFFLPSASLELPSSSSVRPPAIL